MKKILIFLGVLTLGLNIFAIEIVQLKDGRKIIINDDYTWEEIKIEEFVPEKKSNTSLESITATQAESITQTIETKTIMEKSPELLKSDSKAGVFVSLYKSVEVKDKIQITLMTKNTNDINVVRVTNKDLSVVNRKLCQGLIDGLAFIIACLCFRLQRIGGHS